MIKGPGKELEYIFPGKLEQYAPMYFVFAYFFHPLPARSVRSGAVPAFWVWLFEALEVLQNRRRQSFPGLFLVHNIFVRDVRHFISAPLGGARLPSAPTVLQSASLWLIQLPFSSRFPPFQQRSSQFKWMHGKQTGEKADSSAESFY